MSDYIIPSAWREAALALVRPFHPDCEHMDDDEFEAYLLGQQRKEGVFACRNTDIREEE